MTKTEKAIRDFCGHCADWWPSATQVQEMLALAQPEQEPVACVYMKGKEHDIDFYQSEIDAIPVGTFLYTTPPQRPWVGLTPEEILDLFDVNNVYGSKWIAFARTVEAALKKKNT